MLSNRPKAHRERRGEEGKKMEYEGGNEGVAAGQDEGNEGERREREERRWEKGKVGAVDGW